MKQDKDLGATASQSLAVDPWDMAEGLLGRCGAMLSGAKQADPERRVVWNGNVCTRADGKVWFGDISLRDSAEQLQALANRLNAEVFVLREHDARFQTEKNPAFENAVEVFAPAEDGS